MERVMGIGRPVAKRREAADRAERLRHRRAADERCVRAGLLRQCRPVEPGAGRRPA